MTLVTPCDTIFLRIKKVSGNAYNIQFIEEVSCKMCILKRKRLFSFLLLH